MIRSVGNIGGMNNVGQMGPCGNNVMGNNLLPMDQWGGNRYPNNVSQGMRQSYQNQVLQQNPMQQQNNKDDIKPLVDGNSGTGSDIKVKIEPKPIIPEPFAPNAGDKKKKCATLTIIVIFVLFHFLMLR
ncbi:uncharacterized protein ACN2A1_002718 [Glossina fuscipes fuscipes]